MIIKKLILISILFLLTSCGYEKIYSKKNDTAISIKKIELEGNKKISRKIISLTNLRENNNKNYTYNLTLVSNKTIEAVSKNKSGNISVYKTTINVEFYLKDPNDKNKIIKQKKFNSSFSYNNIDNKFDLSQYQRNIEENLINKIAEEISSLLGDVKKEEGHKVRAQDPNLEFFSYIYYFTKEEDRVSIECYDLKPENEYNSPDQLRIGILEYEFVNWLMTKAY